MLRKFQLGGWRQFEHVEIEFHDRLTVLTGANGAGKTTILNLVNRHFGWNLAFVSTPRLREGTKKYLSDYWDNPAAAFEIVSPPSGSARAIGSIRYEKGPVAELRVPTSVSDTYDVEIKGMRNLPGVFVSSHRPLFVYKKLATIPAELDLKRQLLDAYFSEVRARYSVGSKVTSPSYRLKESLASLAVFGYGNDAVTPDPKARLLFEGFENVLRTMLPRTLGFRRLLVTAPDVLLETTTGLFSLDAVSGGVAAVIDMSWQVFIRSEVGASDFLVVIDEPENHLHPSLQQSLLPNFLEAFPRARFVVATHNPLVVTSVRDAAIYVLRYNSNEKVQSEQLDIVNRSATANEVLREVLGLPFTMPIWASVQLDSILAKFSSHRVTQQSLDALRSELVELGMSDLLPTALHRLFSSND